MAGPIVGLLDWSARLGLSLLGQSRHQETGLTDEEIKTMIAEAERTGLVEPEERSMISRVMLFGDRSVRGIMTPRPDIEWIDLMGTDEEFRSAVRGARHRLIIAANADPDNVVGVIPTRTALVALMDGGAQGARALIQQVPVVSDRLRAIDVVEQLRQSRLSLVLVVDEHGSLEGIVTEGDILRTIVADIQADEEPHITLRDDGSFLIDGAFPADELGQRLGISLPDDRDYHTTAGFVLDRMRRLPKAGEAFRYGHWRFEVLDLDGHRVDKVLATAQPTLHRSV